MLHRIKGFYKNPNESRINTAIMNREYEKSLEEYVVDCFKSIENVLPEIHLTDWDFVIDVDKVSQSDYEKTRSTKIKDQEQKYMYISESRVGELVLRFKVDMEDDKPLYYVRKLLVPIPDENGYYLIKGIKYVSQYQLTEASTYVTSSCLVMKSLMPIKVKREKSEGRDVKEDLYGLSVFKVCMFTGFTNIFYFYFASMGVSNTLEYFNVGNYVQIVRDEDYDPKYVYFRVSSDLMVKVLKPALGSSYIQAMVGTLLDALTNRMSYEDVMNKDVWITKIGSTKKSSQKETHYELGLRYLVLFNRMLDEATKKVVRLTEYNRKDIYALIRWMVQCYDELRQKDNLDVSNKRLRCNEYIASLLNGLISERIKKFVNTTANTKEKIVVKYNNFFSYRGNELVSRCHKSGLIKYDDLVNDMNMFQKFKMTTKGPNAIGNKNNQNVSSRQRALHPSHIGKFGLSTCSASDPGLTNYLNILCETDGLFFKDAPPEPEDFALEFANEIRALEGEPELSPDEKNGKDEILIFDPVKFNNTLDALNDIHIMSRGRKEEAEENDQEH